MRLLCVAMRAYPYIKNANNPNLQNFENERTISMNKKNFLTKENAIGFAAGFVALSVLRAVFKAPPAYVFTDKNVGSVKNKLHL